MFRLTVSVAMMSVVLQLTMPNSAVAGECSQLGYAAQKAARYYRNNPDSRYHYQHALNLQNAYNACIASVGRRMRPRTATSTPYFEPFSTLRKIFGQANDLNIDESERARRAAEFERDQAEQRALIERQERELQQMLAAKREEMQRRERELREIQRVARLEQQALARRCAEKNPFGGGQARACGGMGHVQDNPFGDGEERNPFERVESPAPDWSVGSGVSNTYDSVNRIDCPELMKDGCLPDTWRDMLATIKRDGDIFEALRQAQLDNQMTLYGDEFLVSQEEFELLAQGQLTFADIEQDRRDRMANRPTLKQIEAEIDSLRNNAKFQELVDKMRE